MNVVLELMKKAGIAMTRGNYLKVAYLGDIPHPLSAEEEADIPSELEIVLRFSPPRKKKSERRDKAQ